MPCSTARAGPLLLDSTATKNWEARQRSTAAARVNGSTLAKIQPRMSVKEMHVGPNSGWVTACLLLLEDNLHHQRGKAATNY